MEIERNPDLELSRQLRLDRVPPAGVVLDIAASERERDALARRFGVLSVPELSAGVSLRAEGPGRWRVEGRLQALVVQACGITLEPVEQRIDETFVLRFTSDREEIDRETGELIVGAEAAEPLEADSLDLGDIVADQLGLAIDPFPRKPGAQLTDILPPAPDRPAEEGPFAALAALKRGGKGEG
jgi:uncharacterized metal-binding protein YceD (DUF177 family)